MKNLNKFFKILPIEHEILNTSITKEVSFPNDLSDLFDLMKDTLRYHKGVRVMNGVALTSSQVGRKQRFFLMGNIEHSDPLRQIDIYLNPYILEYSSETADFEQGCLSIPEYNAIVERPISILLKYQNEKGQKQQKQFHGLQARIIQHQFDHFEGTNVLKKAQKIVQNQGYEQYIKEMMTISEQSFLTKI